MPVSFNLKEDARFQTSLESLERTLAFNTIKTLREIQKAAFSWEKFVEEFDWEPMRIQGSDTYPGANELYSFQIVIDDDETQIEVIGYTYNNEVIVCSVARLA